MNAIILAAGKSSRMYEGGASLPKGLLPILSVPNIERTILMLHMLDIYEIIIAVPFESIQFEYLKKQYSCTVIHIPSESMNTLTTMNYLIDYIGDTFIIEGDVVCAKNIFKVFEYTTYYVMEYAHPESDEWNVITDSDNNIVRFEVGTHLTPAIFGISFWTHKDSLQLKKYLKMQMQNNYKNKPDFFWDDNIADLLGHICLKAYEITFNMACEMNTVTEYLYAKNLCKKMLSFPNDFFDNVFIRKKNIPFSINNTNRKTSLKWLKKLLEYYNERLIEENPCCYDEWFNYNELVFIIKNHENKEVAFFSFIIEDKYILLRRLFIESPFRSLGLGKELLNYIRLFAISGNKELRVNAYDENAAKFYTYLGAKKIFSTYHWKLCENEKGDKNE